MDLVDFRKLREGREGCPSEMVLERLAADELTGEARRTAATHVEDCAHCSARLAECRQGFAAYPEVDPRRLLAGIRRGVDEKPVGPFERWSRALRLLLAPLAVAGIAVVALTVRPGSGERVEPTRAKGAGPALHVYRLVNGAPAEAFSGDRFQPGEPLRFSVDLEENRAVVLVGIDAAGQLYRVWPTQGNGTTMPAGRAEELDGAVSLDASPGAETFFLVACPPGVAPACTSNGGGTSPSCPPGCSATPFVLKKAL